MTPISETTVLVPSMVGGVTTNEHIGAMIWTSGPAVVLAIVGLRDPRAGHARRRRRHSTRRGAGRAGRGVPHLARSTCCRSSCSSSCRSGGRRRSCRSSLSALFAAVLACFTQTDAGRGIRRASPSRGRCYADRGDLRGMANGFVLEHGQRDDRRAVLAGRHGLDAVHDLAGPGRAELRGDHGGRRLPGAADPAGPRRARSRPAALIAAVVGHLHRPQHHRRRPVRRDRDAQPDLPARVRQARDRAADAVAGGRGFGHGHLAAHPVEQLRRVHGRRARRGHGQPICRTASSTCSAR